MAYSEAVKKKAAEYGLTPWTYYYRIKNNIALDLPVNFNGHSTRVKTNPGKSKVTEGQPAKCKIVPADSRPEQCIPYHEGYKGPCCKEYYKCYEFACKYSWPGWRIL